MNGTSASDPTLSIVIVSWNDWPKLLQCLHSIYASRAMPSLEVLVIDNGSWDGTPERVGEAFPAVDLHRNASNLGHTRAVNLGFTRSRGDYVLLLDSDTVLDADCIARLHDFLRRNPAIDLVAPRTFNSDGSIQETARDLPGALAGLFGRQATLTRWLPNNPISRKYLAQNFLDATEPFAVQQVSGACMFFRRRLLAEVGLWDDSYFGYWVDTDWCHALHAAGRRIVCLPAARIVHHESNARGKRKSPRRIWMFHYGAYLFYTRRRTLGHADPRSILAGSALLVRAGVVIAQNLLPRPKRRPIGWIAWPRTAPPNPH
jgi:N-acetylglucosaminyl-diphospho-decaprenol L-rhamnosyltransferase